MKLPLKLAGLIALAACQTVPETETETSQTPLCAPLETSATFSCWWSSADAPLSHCVMVEEDEPACNLKVKGGAYLTRGALVRETMTNPPGGTWLMLNLYEDAEGKVGQLAFRTDGADYLWHHWSSPVPTGPISPPRWPRWPGGVEFGPEQERPPQ